ncbi:GH92 family glycosyl hydrolase [Streptomyces acidiscabies]|uniref:Alpha-mannosidase n=1 Tax=Streptomyces acidiscabies TaxID=42234 RepID=A0A0L0K4L0_9ACTN|nr:GH92 family glycosyl hydrolase [Streptomyces acidiscabies]KND32781.1 alpha-mannosidase [Streptomyces acidiscabies]
MRERWGRGWRGKRFHSIVVACATVVVLSSPGVVGVSAGAVAGVSAGASAGTETVSYDGYGGFATSFEDGEPAPDWTDTVDEVRGASGVDGGYDAGGLPGDVTDQVTGVRASGENTGGGEVKENLVDGEPGTKWLVFEPTGWAEFDLARPVSLVSYALTSANDAPERDPADWKLLGSTDGSSWAELDAQTGVVFQKRFESRTYALPAAAAFSHFRLEVTANRGAGLLQLADVRFGTGGSAGPVPPTMLTGVDRGPSGSPTAKARAGFTGVRALRYAGRQTSAGAGWSYNKVLDVEVPVGRGTRLGYRIFPAMGDGDLDYAATNVAVDLAFTDGTLLSSLGAVDQYGFEASPRGQGAAKVLYVNQWNDVEVALGAAAGKTVDRVLVGYDSGRGAARFRGWVDDVRIGVVAEAPRVHLSDYAVTTRGTNSSGAFSRGNTFPATAVPHGFNFWTPVTDASSLGWLYQYARGNNSRNLPEIQAFGVSHEPSPWMGDRQTFQVMPVAGSGVPPTGRGERAAAFRHEDEVARPYGYRVGFEGGMGAEVAPTDHAAVMRFTFPGASGGSVVFDNVKEDAGLSLDVGKGVVTGYSDVKSGLSTGASRLFVYGEFAEPVKDGAVDGVKGYARFDTSTVTLRIATSLIGLDQARDNLRQEIPAGWSFEQVRDSARAQWDELLGRVRVEGATPDQLTTLYSSLYRLYLYPNSGFEKVGSAYRYASSFSPPTGPDTPTHAGAKVVDGKVYVNNGFWDTYRTAWPAYSLLTPRQAGELVDGFVQQYRDGGWISRWSSPGYADLMTGTSSDVAFADAYVKGVDFDARAAYEAALKNATVVPPSSGVGRKGMATSPFLGYTATDTHEGLSWALEGYVNDYGLARMGQELYRRTGEQRYREESAYFLDRARGYVRLFDSRAGFFQGRDAKGDWRVPSAEYDPRVWGYDYTETNGWGYAFTAPQDSRGLANLYGGRGELGRKLDAYLSTPETASVDFAGSYEGVIHEMTEARDVRMGMYGHSNQVAHHALYMYLAAGQPWKTQAAVREVLSRLYTGSSIGQGYHGDEDNGEQSAWYLFSALGFYPLVMGSGEYAIGSPLFTKATVRMDSGRTLVVKAPGNSARNVYVQGVRFNGRALTSTSLPHSVISRGGVLEFAMGPRPSSWGAGSGPVSITQGDAVPRPREDVLRRGGALFDDTSASSAAVTSVDLPVSARVNGVQYTLTSGPDPARAPRAWTLQGSDDGVAWATLDRRDGESFSWGRQTRAFGVGSAGTYGKYRLLLDGEAVLSEVELLA